MNEKRKQAYILEWSKKIRAINLLGGKCQECGEDRPWVLSFHHKEPKEKDYCIKTIKNYRWSMIEKEVLKCKLVCHNCHHKIHFLEVPKNNKRNENKVMILDFLKKNKCEKCGYDESNKSLHFHHKNLEDKKFAISQFTNSKRIKSINEIGQAIIEELNKCDLICSNCHFDSHFDKEKFEKYKDEIYKWDYKETQEPLNKEEVMKLYNEGMKQVDIAKKFGRNKSVICSIIKRYLKNVSSLERKWVKFPTRTPNHAPVA